MSNPREPSESINKIITEAFFIRHESKKCLNIDEIAYVNSELYGTSVDTDFTVSSNAIQQQNYKEAKLTELIEELSKQKYVIHIFNRSNIEDIIQAIEHQKIIEGVDLIERMQNPDFRFLAKKDPVYSLSVSNAFATAIKANKSLSNKKASKTGVKKRQQKADEFAIKMKEVFEEINPKDRILTFRETVTMLNDKSIPSHRGKKWHVGSLQQLYKRWNDLGISVSAPHSFSPPY